MKIIVCGGRNYQNKAKVNEVLSALKPTLIVHSGATGADMLAEEWALSQPRDIKAPILKYPANWADQGKSAGPIRNQIMLDSNPDIDALVAFQGGDGTDDMIQRTMKTRPDVRIYVIKEFQTFHP